MRAAQRFRTGAAPRRAAVIALAAWLLLVAGLLQSLTTSLARFDRDPLDAIVTVHPISTRASLHHGARPDPRQAGMARPAPHAAWKGVTSSQAPLASAGGPTSAPTPARSHGVGRDAPSRAPPR
jgi:hypothetical protein